MKRAQAKQLRSRMTDAERRLWYRLRAHRFNRLKFKRQAPIGPYVVDFICFEYKLIVEVDGGQHSENDTDRRRDEWLRGEGYTVLRFWNNDVLQDTSAVLASIASAVTDASTPFPARCARHPLPAELGYTRVLPLFSGPKSDISDFGWERGPEPRG